MLTHQEDETRCPAGVTFRTFRDDSDYERLRRIAKESEEADGGDWEPALEEIRAWCAPTARFDPSRQIVFAMAPGQAASEVGASRVSWYTTRGSTRVYSQASFLVSEWRRPGIWPALLREGDRRARALAASHPASPDRAHQAWASESQTAWIAALEAVEYRAVRHFRNMVRPLGAVPELEAALLPDGIDVRPVTQGHMRAIWDAQAEVNQELFEYVAEQWAEDRYPGWLADASHTPRLWQVAWDGAEVAGMVLPRVDDAAGGAESRKRGFTEHVFVRRPWRGNGLAKALLVRGLRALKDEGMDEAELGVDSENDSGAYRFYERMGYATERTDIWFRKPLELSES